MKKVTICPEISLKSVKNNIKVLEMKKKNACNTLNDIHSFY